MRRGVVLRILAGLAGSVVAIALVARTTDIPGALAEISSVDPRLLLAPFLVVGVQLWVRGLRWSLLLTAVGDMPTGPGRAFWPLSAGYLGNAVLPARLGEVMRIVFATKWLGLRATGATASVVVERAVDLLALLAVAGVAYGLLGGVGLLAVAAVLALLVAFGVGLRFAGWLAAHLPGFLPAGLRSVGGRLLLAFESIRPKVVATAFVVGLVNWALDATLMFLCAVALGIEISPWVAVLISSGAALGAALPAAAGALGTYELGAVTMAGVIGIPGSAALSVALLGHLVGLAAVAVLGALGLVVMGVVPGRAPSGQGEDSHAMDGALEPAGMS